MNFKTWGALVLCAAITASCGDSSTKDKEDTKDTTVITTVPVPPPPMIEVPEATRVAFETKYPTATDVVWARYEPVEDVDWSWTGWPAMDTNDYYVRYKIEANEFWTWFDGSDWVGTVSTVTNHASLPVAVNTTVSKTFPGYAIVSVKQENDNNRTAYEIKLEKGNDKAKLLVAENGTVLKKVSTVDGEKTKEKTQ